MGNLARKIRREQAKKDKGRGNQAAPSPSTTFILSHECALDTLTALAAVYNKLERDVADPNIRREFRALCAEITRESGAVITDAVADVSFSSEPFGGGHYASVCLQMAFEHGDRNNPKDLLLTTCIQVEAESLSSAIGELREGNVCATSLEMRFPDL